MQSSPSSLAALLSVIALATVVACGSEEMGPEELRCDEEDRAEPYAPGMVAEGEDAVYSVRLLESTPAPPGKGDNSWILDVLDHGSAAPVDGATITVTPFMPDHGHGTSVSPVIAPTGEPGQFQVDKVNLWMPGLWDVIVGVDVGGVDDEAVFRVCIEG